MACPGMLISESVVMMLQNWHLGFSHFLLPVDVAVCGCCRMWMFGLYENVS